MGHLTPSFFIVGERKCGTSSLYRYLLAHPQVLPCKVKEPQFFTQHLLKIWWNQKKYFQLFPDPNRLDEITMDWPELDEKGQLFKEQVRFSTKEQQEYITGEASANALYLANPKVVKRYLPKVKIIMMFRHPVDRAFSHYRMIQRFQGEGRKTRMLMGFEVDMMKEMQEARIGKKTDFIGPGIYINQLKKWEKVFGKDQIFVIRMEDLAKPKKSLKVMNELTSFLNLQAFDYREVLQKRFNVAPATDFPLHMREEMLFYYRPSNLVLEDYLQRKLNWNE